MTFSWLPDFGAERDFKPNVSVVKFGDGYEQRYGQGINILPQSWKLSFANRSSVDAAAIDAFLTTLNGVTPFLWTPPGQAQALMFKCDLSEYTYSPQNGGYTTITATFDQVFG